MTAQMIIVLAIFILMILALISGKWQMSVVAVTACFLFVLTKSASFADAFSGFANKNTFLAASMMCLSRIFAKTSLLDKIVEKMNILNGKSGMAFLALMFFFIIVLGQFMGTSALMAIVISFAASLNTNENSTVTPSRVILPCSFLMYVWSQRLPIGNGAINYISTNAKYEGLGATPEQLLQLTDKFKGSIFTCIVLTIYCLLAFRLIPNKTINTTEDSNGKKSNGPAKKYTSAQETLIYCLFGIVMISLFLAKKLGDIMYVLPGISLLILYFTKTCELKEIVSVVTGHIVWMIAAMLGVSKVLGESGVGAVIGDFFLKVFGSNPNAYVVLFTFAIVTMLMGTFIGTGGTVSIMTPISAAVALQAGWDPRGLVIMVGFCAAMVVLVPTTPVMAMAYGACGFKAKDVIKFTLPFLAIAIITIVLGCNFMFPLIG